VRRADSDSRRIAGQKLRHRGIGRFALVYIIYGAAQREDDAKGERQRQRPNDGNGHDQFIVSVAAAFHAPKPPR